MRASPEVRVQLLDLARDIERHVRTLETTMARQRAPKV